jgi:sulfate adenylyltransferase subunit 1
MDSAEREQGIIDVAYRYFATPNGNSLLRIPRVIFAYLQYGYRHLLQMQPHFADARNGSWNKPYGTLYCILFQIPRDRMCNKMDSLISKRRFFERIQHDFNRFSDKLDIKDVYFIPISALKGDNVVDRSKNMPWYQGPTLMYSLEHLHISNDQNFTDPRFPVQFVVRPNSDDFHDYRGYAGRVAGGVQAGRKGSCSPSGFTTKIKSIDTMNEPWKWLFHPSQSPLHPKMISTSAGDMIVKENNQPQVGQILPYDMLFNETHEAGCKTLIAILPKMQMHSEANHKININNLKELRTNT